MNEPEPITVLDRYEARLGREYDTVVVFDPPERTVRVEELPRDIRTFRQYHRLAYELARARGANWANVDDLVALLQSAEVQELLQAVAAGHSVEWNGSDHVGRLTEDASCCLERLERLLEPIWDRLPGLTTAEEWFCYSKPELTGNESDQELLELARAEVSMAEPEQHLDQDDLVAYFTQRRQEARERAGSEV